MNDSSELSLLKYEIFLIPIYLNSLIYNEFSIYKRGEIIEKRLLDKFQRPFFVKQD